MIRYLKILCVLLIALSCGAWGSGSLLWSGGEEAAYDVCNESGLHEFWPLTSDATGACNSIDLSTAAGPCAAPIGYGADGVDLDGVDDCLYTDTNFTFGDDITVIGFIIADEATSHVLISQWDYATNNTKEWKVAFTAANIPVGYIAQNDGVECGDGNDTCTADAAVTEDGTTKYMVAWRHDQADGDQWINFYTTSDCVEVGSGSHLISDDDGCILGTETFIVGAQANNNDAAAEFDGHMKNVALFSGADVLSDAKLVELCNALK